MFQKERLFYLDISDPSTITMMKNYSIQNFVGLTIIIVLGMTNVLSFCPTRRTGITSKKNKEISKEKSGRSSFIVTASSSSGTGSSTTPLYSSSEAGSSSGQWELANDFQTFLNQRTIQSFLYLVNSLRDRQTGLWLEDFTKPIVKERAMEKKEDIVLSNMKEALTEATQEIQVEKEIRLLSYHGLAAINTTLFPTWDTYYEKLLNEPGVIYDVESTRAHVPAYEIEIDPVSLCGRLISVREQIAREFVNDLDVLADMSINLIDEYVEKMKNHNLDETTTDPAMDKQSLVFLELGIDGKYKPSPLRSGNFDLLSLLATQESIHRVLNNDANTEDGDGYDKASIRFLRNFYAKRIESHFTGSYWYGRSSSFIEELLTASPCVVQLQDEECGLVDPTWIAQIILKEREKVAIEWLEAALDVPTLHFDIKKKQLNKRMGIESSS